MANLWQFTKKFTLPEWRWYIAGFVFLAATTLLTLEIPQLAKQIVDQIDQLAGEHDLGRIALAIVGLGFILVIIRTLSRIMIFWPARKIEANARAHLFDRLMQLPSQFFSEHGLGDLISRLSNDIGHLRAFFAFGVLQVLNLIFLTVFAVSKMLSVHVGLTLASLSPLILMLLIARFANPRMHLYSKLNQEAIGQLTNEVTTSFVNIHVIQTNAAEQAFQKRIARENENVLTSNMRLVFIRHLIWPLFPLLTGLSQAVVFLYGGSIAIEGEITTGDIMAFNVYIGFLAFPLVALGMIMAIYQRALTALERLQTIEVAKTEGGDQTLSIDTSDNGLTIRNLSFRFAGSDTLILDQLNLTINPGEKIGIFGPIGSGKTTLFNLITRLTDPPQSTIFIGGHDVLGIQPKSLRRLVNYVPQTAFLFSNSVAENLTLGNPEDDSEQRRAAAANAQVLEEIERFPSGWDTQIGERGLRLSGGQKQRLSLARAFLRRPGILLLDDVLSAVDSATEHELVTYLRSLDATLLIASHRVSILRACDRVVILQAGKITACAPMHELEEKFPHFFLEADHASST